LTWHQTESRLVCHYCSYATIKPDICPKCKSKEFHPFGLGTQKVEEVISKIEPGFSVIRMDFDTTIGKRGHQKILDSFRENNIDVLVGTQMIAKGHDFPDVTLVGILNADSLLGSGDYRASERTFQLITQSAGRAGRATKQGRVVLQTYNVDDFSIQAAVHQDYKAFFDQEIKLRKELKLPPFFQFGCIQITGKNNNQVRSVSRKIYSEITRRLVNIPDVFLSDPAPSPIMKIKNRYRWRIILKHQSIKTLGNILEWVYDTYGTNAKGEWSVSVDINPGSML
jgi:primosomal protein N' (replication factor Y)